jgi:hypothetical protein
LDETSLHSRRRPADEEKGADQAKQQLRRGIERSRTIVADYRRQLTRLARAPGPSERPLFGWRRD